MVNNYKLPHEMLQNDPIRRLRFIGPLFADRFAEQGIHTALDLVLTLYAFQMDNATKNHVRDWLRHTLRNARPNQCSDSTTQHVNDGVPCKYLIRPFNFMAYSQVLDFWHHWAPELHRFIPARLRPWRSVPANFPRKCRVRP